MRYLISLINSMYLNLEKDYGFDRSLLVSLLVGKLLFEQPFCLQKQQFTVEVGRFRLESLKLVFNHSTNFLLTNYSFGKSVGTSTLCKTQVTNR